MIASYVPPTDITQEFKVQTATYDAQFGNTEGGVTSIAIKSGTNGFHGTAYEFGRSDRFDAQDFFAKQRPVLKQNQYINFASAPSKNLADVHLTILQKVFGGKDTLFGKPQGMYATPTGHTMAELLA